MSSRVSSRIIDESLPSVWPPPLIDDFDSDQWPLMVSKFKSIQYPIVIFITVGFN